MDPTANFTEEMLAAVNREVYTKEHDEAIEKAVEQICIDLVDLFDQHKREMLENFPKLNCETGKSYIDFTMCYNLALKNLEDLFSQADEVGKESLKDMLENDICEIIGSAEEELEQKETTCEG